MKLVVYSTKAPIITEEETGTSPLHTWDQNDTPRMAQLRMGVPDIANFKELDMGGIEMWHWSWFRIVLDEYERNPKIMISDVRPLVEPMSHRYPFPEDADWDKDIVPHLIQHNVPKLASCTVAPHPNMDKMIHIWSWFETKFEDPTPSLKGLPVSMDQVKAAFVTSKDKDE